ncbi:MAG: hypothetical protein ABIF88_00015 [archaeon]
MVMNKKGQDLTLGTIILIVLGIAVLIFLIFGFSTGWNNLWERITGFGGGGVNVDTIKQSCAIACSTRSSYDFCELDRTVKYGKEVDGWNGTGISKVKSSVGNCNSMTDSTKYPSVNIVSCPGIC